MSNRNDLLSRCEQTFRGQEVLISTSDDRWLVYLMPSRAVGDEPLMFDEPSLSLALDRAAEWLEVHQKG